MYKLIFYFVLVLFHCGGLHAQTNCNSSEPSEINIIIGVVTVNTDDFPKVVDFLNATPGIQVNDYCCKDHLLNITINVSFFVEEAKVFEIIYERFPDSKCYRKGVNSESYRKLCFDELSKQKNQ